MVGHVNQRAECLNIQVSNIFLSRTPVLQNIYLINLEHFFFIDHSGIHLRISVVLCKEDI